MNPANWLLETARASPDAPALFTGTTQVANYREFATRAAAIGAHLQTSLGLTKGDRVALFMPNSTRYLEALYGIWFAGGTVVPINAKLHEKEARWIIKNAAASVVFTTNDHMAGFQDIPRPHTIAVDGIEFETLYETSPLGTPVTLSPQDLVWLFYTSGTTGRPKGVMLTAANIAAVTQDYPADIECARPDTAVLYAAPLSHGAGLYNFPHIRQGARHIIPASGGFDAEEILTLAPQLGNVSMFAAPTMVRRLVERAKQRTNPGAGFNTIIYGGAPMYLADIIDAVDTMGPLFVQIYGLGECPMSITSLARDLVADRCHPNWQARLASAGVAQSSVTVQIQDETGQQVQTGKIGEICVKGTPVMAGYWQNPEATENALVSGWLKTGDLGSQDSDGFITLRDRAKDMVISGGANIYPREVEEALLLHTDVSEVSVVGQPDPEWGELVVAFVVARGVGVDDLDSHCLNHIARFKRPRKYHFVPELPKNNYGKVLKTELRKMLKPVG